MMIKQRAGLAMLMFAAFAMSAAAQTVTGSGTTNTVPVFSGTSTVGNSPISVSGSNVGIGTATPNAKVYIAGGGYGSVGGANQAAYALGAQSIAADASIYSYGAICTGNNWGNCSNSNGVVLGINNTSATVNIPNSGYTFFNGGNVGIGTTGPAALLHLMPSDAFSYDYTTGVRVSRAGSDPTDQYVGLNDANGTANLISRGYQDYGYFQFLQYNGTTYRPAVLINNLGNVGIGTTSPQFSLDVTGQIHSAVGIVFPDGTTQTTAFSPTICGGDYAESVDVTGSRTSYEPGDVLVIDPGAPGKFLKSKEPYSTLVTGIYSTKPGTVGRRQTTAKSPDEVPMAMMGIVPTKVSAENGPVKVGDLLVTSSTIGYAMKGTDRNRMLGAVIGKALGNLDSGTGVIEVVVTLQ